MAKITAPVEGFTGVVAGVHFADGVGETEDPSALFYFERRGYGIESAEAPEGDEDDQSSEDHTSTEGDEDDQSSDVPEVTPTEAAPKRTRASK